MYKKCPLSVQFTANVRRIKTCMLYYAATQTTPSEKPYTRKDLVMTETSIYDFHTSFYIPSIQDLEYHVSHVCIIGTHHCGNTHCEVFKLSE